MALNPIAAPADIFAKCTPNYGLGSQRCGGLTLMDISATNGTDLNSIYADEDGKYRVLGALVQSDFTGRACQIKQNILYDWLMATARTWGSKKVTTTPLKRDLIEVMPFIQMARVGIINANYWNVVGNSTTAGTSPGGVAYTHYFDIQSQTEIPASADWFSAKTEIYIRGRNTSTGVNTTTQWTVKDAEVQVDPMVLRVYVVSVNLNSSFGSAARQVPTTGVVTRGVPNVNDYEKYCSQIPGINPNQRALFWIQDTRWTLCIDEMTEKLLMMVRDNNPQFREFGDIMSAELNRQILQDFQARFVETAFWQKPLPNQSVSDYQNLEVITAADGGNVTDYLYLPGVTGRVIGRRANAVGFYEQLAECGRVKDLGGLILNIPELLAELYLVKRHRENNNIPSDVIEIITNSSYAVALRQGFFRYLNSRYEGALRVNMDVASMIKKAPGGFTFTDVEVDYPAGLTVRIVTHQAFDDLLDAYTRANSAMEPNGNMCLILDLGNSMYVSILESNSQTNKTGDIAALASVSEDFLCRMKVPQRSMSHKSMKFTTVVECPGASLWMENIGRGIPEHCGPVGSPTDLAGDQV